MEQAIVDFCTWLSGTALSVSIQTISWIIPLVQSVHIMAITVVMGSVLMIDMKLLGVVGRGTPVTGMVHRFAPWIWTALVVLLATGSILTIAEPARELTNLMFRIKMALILVVGAVTVVFQTAVQRQAGGLGRHPLQPGRRAGAGHRHPGPVGRHHGLRPVDRLRRSRLSRRA
ncbi:MAG: DUF6644 family protein [Caulobacteraceae bacterium]